MVYGLGILSYLLEIFLFRELFVLLQGQDVVIGWMYLVWFLFSGLGALMMSRIQGRYRLWIDLWLITAPYLLVFFALVIILLRWSPRLCLGAEMSLGQSFLTVIAVLSLPAFFCGMGFSIFKGWFGDGSYVFSRESVAFGITAILVFLGLEVGIPFQWMIALGISFIPLMLRRQHRFVGVITIFLPILFLVNMDHLEQAKVCAKGHLILKRDTPSGRIEIWQRGGERAMFFNRRYVSDFKDYGVSETVVHGVFLNITPPDKVLVIGDLGRGIVREILKYKKVKKVVVVEREKSLLEIEKTLYHDPRVDFGLMRDKWWQGENFDVIFLTSGPPSTIADAGMFSCEFFSRLKKILAPKGWLVVGLPGAEAFLSSDLARMFACITKTLRALFPETTLLIGKITLIIGGPRKIVWDPEKMQTRYIELRLGNHYFNPYNWQVILSPFHQSLLRAKVLSFISRVRVSSDWYPFTYRFFWLFKLWEQGSVWRKVKEMLPMCWVIIFSLVSLILVGLFSSKLRDSLRMDVVLSSYLHMAMYLMLIYGLQMFWATFFRDIAILSGAYMIGLGLGSSRPISYKRYWKILFFVLLIASVLGLFPLSRFLLVIWVFLQAWVQGQFLAGLFRMESVAEKIYFADLIGAGLGSILVSPVLLLQWGLVGPWLVLLFVGAIAWSLSRTDLL